MSILGSKIKKVADYLTPDPENERLIFRRFPGEILLDAAINNKPVDSSKVTKVVLKVNPQQISFSERKNVQKIPTSQPGRFVVFDWGSELVMMSITGVTGNLLPSVVTDGFGGGALSTAADLASLFGDSGSASEINRANNAAGAVAANWAQNLFIGKMSYYELISLSPKYKTFLELKNMYKMFDADKDVLTLEMGDYTYRGFFEQFDFTMTAESPWNWAYTINFIVLDDLNETVKRNDASFNSNNSNINMSE
jgi:hypothetical protein